MSTGVKITYLAMTLEGSFFYLYLILDVFSRKIVGWDVYDSEHAQFNQDFFFLPLEAAPGRFFGRGLAGVRRGLEEVGTGETPLSRPSPVPGDETPSLPSPS